MREEAMVQSGKEVTIKRIENGFMIRCWTPIKQTETYKKTVDEAVEEAKRVLGY